MKTCNHCKKELPLSGFNKRTASKDGLQPLCRECNSIYSKAYYHKDRKSHIAVIRKNKKKYSKRIREFLHEVKSHYGCMLCVEDDPCCIDFHHVGKKSFVLGRAPTLKTSIETVRKEVEKCACLCSNCHRKLHAGKLKISQTCKVPPQGLEPCPIG